MVDIPFYNNFPISSVSSPPVEMYKSITEENFLSSYEQAKILIILSIVIDDKGDLYYILIDCWLLCIIASKY